MQHCQENTLDGCMIDYRGKKRACCPSSGLAWPDLMAISIGSTLQRRTSVHVDKQERPWNTSCFDVRSGLHSEQHYCNVAKLTGTISPSSWAGNRPLMICIGRQIWKLCEPRYDSRSPRADSTPLNHADQHNDTLITNLHLPPCAKYSGRRKTRLQASLLTKLLTHKDPYDTYS
jgi:hypothetical protein